MRKKFLTALVSASVAALALSGCGGKTSESTAAADQNSAAAESSSESAGGEGAKKVLRFGQANAGDGLDMQTSTSSRAAYPITWIITLSTHILCYCIIKRRLTKKLALQPAAN